MNDKPHDPVNHPKHYTSHPSGVEAIEIARHASFNIGNVIKYCWRSGLKDGNPSVQDLRKAKWYLEDEIRRIEGKPDHVLDMAPGEGIAKILRGDYHNDVKSGIDDVAAKINEAVNPLGEFADIPGESLDALEAEMKKSAAPIVMIDGKPHFVFDFQNGEPVLGEEVPDEWDDDRYWDYGKVIRWRGATYRQSFAKTSYSTTYPPDQSERWTRLPE